MWILQSRALLLLATLFLPFATAHAPPIDNVLKIANGSEINSLDPAIQDVARLAVQTNTYDPLYRWLGCVAP